MAKIALDTDYEKVSWRCRPLFWCWAFVPILVLWMLAVGVKLGDIESDLAARAESALSASGHDWARVESSGRSLRLAGDAPDDAARFDALRVIAEIRGVERAENARGFAQLPPPPIKPPEPEIEPEKTAAPPEMAAEASSDTPENAPDDAAESSAGANPPDAPMAAVPPASQPAPVVPPPLAPVSAAPEQGTGVEAAVDALDKPPATTTDALDKPADAAARLAPAPTASPSASEAPQNPAQASAISPSAAAPAEAVTPAPQDMGFRVVIERDGADVTMSGRVARDGDKVRLQDAVAGLIRDANLDSALQTGADAPDSWLLAVNFGLIQLARLDSGRFELEETTMRLTGRSGDGNVAFELKALAQTRLPDGFVLAEYEIEGPQEGPLQWSAERSEGRIVLAGAVPGEEVREDLMKMTVARFPGFKVEDNMVMSEASPGAFAAAAGLAIGQLRRLASGRAEISQNRVSVTGEVFTPSALSAVRTKLKTGLPPDYEAEEHLVLMDPGEPLDKEACQKAVSNVMSTTQITFENGLDVIDADSHDALDRIAHIAGRCSKNRLEVGGHTDSIGQPAFNKSLSRRRAASVVGYLIEAGVSSDRLTAVGYGSLKPIASNATGKGRAKNRRIEFTIQ